MVYKKLYRAEYTFLEEVEVQYIDHVGIDITENISKEDEGYLLEMMNQEVVTLNRPFNKISIWDEKAFVKRESIHGGEETWTVEVVYALEIEGKLFKLEELVLE